jgi:hypothetical protein
MIYLQSLVTGRSIGRGSEGLQFPNAASLIFAEWLNWRRGEFNQVRARIGPFRLTLGIRKPTFLLGMLR